MNPPKGEDKPKTEETTTPNTPAEGSVNTDDSSENSLEDKQTDDKSVAAKQENSSETDNNVPEKKSFFGKIFAIFKKFDIYLLIFIFLILVAAIVGYIAVQKNQTSKTPNVNSQTLNQSAIKQISGNDTEVGGTNQTLEIQSSAVFDNDVLVKNNLQVAGTLQVSGGTDLPNLTVTGTSALGQINAGSMTLTGSGTIKGQLTVNQGLSVNGITSFSGAVNAPEISVSTLAINGDITISHHIYVTGSIPKISQNNAIGGGGTSSVNGSDTSGNININTGNGASAGCLVDITFAQSFSTTPYIEITPVGEAAGNNIGYYITRSTSGFSICANQPPSNAAMSFDYYVVG